MLATKRNDQVGFCIAWCDPGPPAPTPRESKKGCRLPIAPSMAWMLCCVLRVCKSFPWLRRWAGRKPVFLPWIGASDNAVFWHRRRAHFFLNVIGFCGWKPKVWLSRVGDDNILGPSLVGASWWRDILWMFHCTSLEWWLVDVRPSTTRLFLCAEAATSNFIAKDLPSHNDHDTNNVKACIQKLQPTSLSCYTRLLKDSLNQTYIEPRPQDQQDVQ
jgi:hypothetical protein